MFLLVSGRHVGTHLDGLQHNCVNVRMCDLHIPHRTGHIENYKQLTADLQLVALFAPHFSFFPYNVC